MFLLRRSIRITGTREDGSPFDPVAESLALEAEMELVRRYRQSACGSFEPQEVRRRPRNSGAYREPAMYGAQVQAGFTPASAPTLLAPCPEDTSAPNSDLGLLHHARRLLLRVLSPLSTWMWPADFDWEIDPRRHPTGSRPAAAAPAEEPRP